MLRGAPQVRLHSSTANNERHNEQEGFAMDAELGRSIVYLLRDSV
jgi:hypothetical protein